MKYPNYPYHPKQITTHSPRRPPISPMFLTLPFSGNHLPLLRSIPSGGHRRRTLASAAPATGEARRVAPSLYEVLRVEHTATVTEIKTAYRSLAKRFHPDAGEGAADGREFIAIHDAYTTLADPAARAQYDRSIGRVRGGVGSGGMRPRRWETDQCW